MLLAYWVHHPTPFLGPHWGNFGIRFYGLGYMLGFLAGAFLLARYAQAGRSLVPKDKIADFMMALVLGVMVGGRIGWFLLYHPEELRHDPLSILRVWEGGMASHGGFAGVGLAIWWFARRSGISYLHLSDLIASTTAVGLLLVRLANFLNGELWGRVTTVPWGVIFEETGGGALPRHPSQLYEAALEGALLLAFAQWRFWCTQVVREQPGRLAGEFLMAYAVVRVIGEIFREPDAALIFGVSRGMFYSIFILIGGALFVLFARRKGNKPDPRVK